MDSGTWILRCQTCRHTFELELKPGEESFNTPEKNLARIVALSQKESGTTSSVSAILGVLNNAPLIKLINAISVAASMTAREYRDHDISVSTIYDTPSHLNGTPIVEHAKTGYGKILATLTIQQSFAKIEDAINRGFELGRKWIDKRLSESQR